MSQTMVALDSRSNVFGQVLNPPYLGLKVGESLGSGGTLFTINGALVVWTDVGGDVWIPALREGSYGIRPG